VKGNSIEEDIKNAEHFINSIKTDKEYKEENGWHGYYNKEIVELARMLEHILSDYKRVLKENEEWDRKFCDLQNLYFKLQDESELKRKEYQETYKDVREELKELKKENEELKERNEYYIPKSVIQDKIEEIINNSTFGCVGCEWNDIEVVQLLENMLLDRRDK
jgi:hypothetical protein